ncbi:hypothetical protein [Jiangella sp. DSM 45060]|uniref:hypothetical protein n=1 Tax=Jiangella sp. DSM 45060 TaxID=1798224 RepID=UPI000879D414|nr:hypothetical protein [Jiangella sp. DSM 45060]SDT63818.1 hypothetical protein SAMN04515669_5329 [Jiangella sp. DSM 45060]
MTTTIRVSREVHQRLTRYAAAHHTSLAGAIERALDAEERAAFWDEVRATMGTREGGGEVRGVSERYAGSLKDGLDPDERWDDVL